jgi:hypothetical protein
MENASGGYLHPIYELTKQGVHQCGLALYISQAGRAKQSGRN